MPLSIYKKQSRLLLHIFYFRYKYTLPWIFFIGQFWAKVHKLPIYQFWAKLWFSEKKTFFRQEMVNWPLKGGIGVINVKFRQRIPFLFPFSGWVTTLPAKHSTSRPKTILSRATPDTLTTRPAARPQPVAVAAAMPRSRWLASSRRRPPSWSLWTTTSEACLSARPKPCWPLRPKAFTAQGWRRTSPLSWF